jgi:hypothetical protein
MRVFIGQFSCIYEYMCLYYIKKNTARELRIIMSQVVAICNAFISHSMLPKTALLHFPFWCREITPWLLIWLNTKAWSLCLCFACHWDCLHSTASNWCTVEAKEVFWRGKNHLKNKSEETVNREYQMACVFLSDLLPPTVLLY